MYSPVLRMSSKGQIVIPKPLRDELDLDKDDEFVAAVSGGNILLKKVKRPTVSTKELKRLVAANEKLLFAAGYKTHASIRALVRETIAEVRAKDR